MRTFLLSSTIVFFVLILIVLFQNIANSVDGLWILFYQFSQGTSAAWGVTVLAGMGFLAGVLTTMLTITLINMGKDQEEPGGSNW